MDKHRDLYLRYVGCLKLLEECSPYVDDEIRDQILRALYDAEKHHENLEVKQILDRCTINVRF